MIQMRVRSGMANARGKGKRIGRPQVTVEDLPGALSGVSEGDVERF